MYVDSKLTSLSLRIYYLIILARDISKRAEVVRNWEDFLNKFMNICNQDEYDEKKNPEVSMILFFS